MRIAHVSDIHIRNLKYHDEYRRVFDDLYTRLHVLKPDLIINTGDTAHTKTQISPEFVAMTSEHLLAMSGIAPYHLILGNHDLNLMNPDRQDAITPIVRSIDSTQIHLHKKSGLAFKFYPTADTSQHVNFWAFSLADPKNYPKPSDYDPLQTNVGLFHGSVGGCVTDLNWRMTNVEHQLDIFDGLDYALLGDIHKQQFFRGRRVAYAGSLIQQNFGEEIEKGFLLWDIRGKDDFEVQPIMLHGSRKFYTVKLNPDLSLPDLQVDEGSRVRVSPPVPITLAQQKEIERNVRRAYKPYDVITLSATDIGIQKTLVRHGHESVENLRQVQVQERLIREHLEDKELPEHILQKILDMNRKYQVHLEQKDETPRNIKWTLDRLAWSNFFNYGGGNHVEFADIPGLTGIFAPNGSGKSAFIDTILETCFDATTKGVNKNIYLINDNKESATAVAHISANDQRFMIEREVNRIKYGQKKFDETKEWGKTSATFSIVDEDGGLEPLTGVSRPETERSIRQRIGTYEDFMLTSLSAQWNPMDIISCKETKRKEILYRFFDLDIFADKGELAKKESREFFDKLKRLEDEGLDKIIISFRNKTFEKQDQLRDRRQDLLLVEDQRLELEQEIDKLQEARPVLKETGGNLFDFAAKLTKVDTEITTQEQKIEEMAEKLGPVETELSKVLKLEQRFDLAAYEAKEAQAKSLQVQISKADIQVLELNMRLTAMQEAAEDLGEVRCSSCQAIVPTADSSGKILAFKGEAKAARTVMAVKQNELQMLSPDLHKLEAYRRFISEKAILTARRDNLVLQMENIRLKSNALKATRHTWLEEKAAWERAEADIRKAETIDKEVRKLQFENARLKDDAGRIQTDLDEINRELGSAQGILEKLTGQMNELQEIRDTCRAFELFQDAMGKDGIALRILVQKLPMLNEEINKILSNAADFGITVDYDPDEQSVRFFMQYGQYKSRLLELAGGAEKFLGSLAIRAGLLSMSNLPKTNMFIVDEGFGKLDVKNLESVQRMFDYLKTVFDHVLIISHVESMRDIVDNIVEITSDEEGYAHVEIGGKDAD